MKNYNMRAWKWPHTRKARGSGERGKWDYSIFFSTLCVSPFVACGDFHARLQFARSTISEGLPEDNSLRDRR